MKKIILSFLLVIFASSMFANPVSEAQARKVALNYYTYRANDTKTDIKISNLEEYSYKGSVAFFIYSFEKGGFIIVSADDAVKPILGYSVSNKLRNNRTNVVLENWLSSYAEQIDYIVSSKLDNSQTIVEWNNILNNNFSKNSPSAVAPLLSTTWDQMGNYNDLCPSNTPTGCVATAMAQIMKYHAWPTTGVFQHSYNHPTYGVQSASFKTTTYDWASMPNTTGGAEVSKLMYHCGVAVDMDYAPDGSGAQTYDVPFVLANYFKYDQTIDYVTKDEGTDAEWISLLKAELDASRPILYSGSSDASGGHAFVCDGYNDSDEFDFNWGWGGYANGYFAIGSLNPAGDDFNDNNSAVIGIKPAITPEFYAVKEYSDLSNVASSTSPYIDQLSVPNDYVAWGIASDGSGGNGSYRIYTRSIDGGLSWEAKELTDFGGTAFSMIYALDKDTAFIAMYGSGSANQILRTTDGGENWESVLSGAGTSSFFNVVHFFDGNNGFAQGDPDSEFELYTTTDGGDNWSRVDGANIPDPNSGEFGIVGHYTAVGDNIWYTTNKGRCYKSTDKGYTWTVSTVIATSSTTYIKLAFNDDATTGLALVTLTDGTNFSYKRYSTADGGTTWTEITNPTGNFYTSDISSVPGVNGKFYSVGSDYQTPAMGISYTTDGGLNWTELADYYQNQQFISVAFASDEKGFFGTFTGDYENGAWVLGNSEPVYANFYGQDTMACVNTDFVFTSSSTGEITDYSWDFGADATPATATGIGPHTVQYSTPGNKTVSLTASNAETSNTLTKDDYVLVADVAPNVIAEITGPATVEQNSTQNYSVPAQDYTFFMWEVSTTMWNLINDYSNSVTVEYNAFQLTKTLSVHAVNGCGVGDVVDLDITVVPAGIDELGNSISISPNPATDVLKINSNSIINNIEIVSTNGQIVYTNNFDANETSINVSDFDKGMYIVNITTENGISTKKIIIK